MTNIHKLADEIFQAPTTDELLERTDFSSKLELRQRFDNWTKWGNKNKYKTVKGLDKKLDELVTLFPNGAYIINSDSVSNELLFTIVDTTDEHCQNHHTKWHLEMDGGYFEKWYAAKTKQSKNVIMIKYRGSSITYIVEK